MHKVICILSIMVSMVLGSTPVVASVSDDQVTSQKIKEADGTSGQNTNSGSGVKTGHIQDGAITANKIVNGAVTNSKISDGAVTDAKIAGPISRMKIERYAKVAIVAQAGGDYADPINAMNDIGTWCGAPTASNPCLLKIMPGEYVLGSPLSMRAYVDIEGSGRNVTKISGSLAGEGMIQGASNTELRSLTVSNNGAFMLVRAVSIRGATSVRLADIVITAENISNSSIAGGIFIDSSSVVVNNALIKASCTGVSCSSKGVYNTSVGTGTDLRIENTELIVTATNDARGVQMDAGSSSVKNATIISSGPWTIGFQNGGSATIVNSIIEAATNPINNYGTLYTSYSRTLNGNNANSGTIKCVYVINGNYDPLNSLCQ